MKRCIGPFAVALAMSPSVFADKPVAESAKVVASRLAAGGIVTAERVGDSVTFASAGQMEPAACPPEKVIFEMGSISKVFTGLLLAQAIVEGKVKLDSTLKELLGAKPAFADPNVAAITLKRLAVHASGLPRVPEDLGRTSKPGDPYTGYDRDKLHAYLQHATLKGMPPFATTYSNLGGGLLGDLLAQVYGRTWDELVVDKIARPLGMKDTSVTLSEEQQQRLAPGYAAKRSVPHWTAGVGSLTGAFALRSTAADMMLFGEALMAPEKTPLADAIKLMLQPQGRYPGVGDIGLFILIKKSGTSLIYSHNGGTGGFKTEFEVVPDAKKVRVVLANNADVEPFMVLSGQTTAPPALAAYEGVYKVTDTINYTVQWRGAGLGFQVTGQNFLPMYASPEKDHFTLKAVPAEIEFSRTSDVVTGITLKQNDMEYPGVKQP